MTRKTVQVLVTIIVALVLLLLVLDRDHDDVFLDRTVLLPGFKDVANKAQSVRITRASEDQGVSISREDERWIVSDRHGYPADMNTLGELVEALANARIVEEKTSNPAHYARLGVDDPGDGGNGARVTVSGPDFTFSVILGDTAQREFRYARVADQATSYLIDQNPSIPDSAGEWLVANIVDIPASRVRKLAITHADGETIVIEKTDEEQTDFAVLDVPDGRELSYATVGNGMAGALAGLELDEVQKRVDAPPATLVDVDTWDGLRVSVEIVTGDEDDATWLAFTATATDGDSAAATEAAAINGRLAGWHYQVADYKKNLLLRRWDDILKTAD